MAINFETWGDFLLKKVSLTNDARVFVESATWLAIIKMRHIPQKSLDDTKPFSSCFTEWQFDADWLVRYDVTPTNNSHAALFSRYSLQKLFFFHPSTSKEMISNLIPLKFFSEFLSKRAEKSYIFSRADFHQWLEKFNAHFPSISANRHTQAVLHASYKADFAENGLLFEFGFRNKLWLWTRNHRRTAPFSDNQSQQAVDIYVKFDRYYQDPRRKHTWNAYVEPCWVIFATEIMSATAIFISGSSPFVICFWNEPHWKDRYWSKLNNNLPLS